jgi:Kelch motif
VRWTVVIPVAIVGLLLIALPLQAVTELPGEKQLKETLGFDYPKSCEDYETVGMGQGGEWRAEPDLPMVRDEPRAALAGGRVFLAGGVVERGDTTASVDTFMAYDFSTGRYERLPALPAELNHVGMTAHEGAVYVVGGFTGGVNDPVASDLVWRYLIDEGRWEELAPLPTARGAMGVAVIGDRMYVVGGRAEPHSVALDTVEVYDFARDRWSAAAPMGVARDHLGVAAQDSYVYAVGGRPGRANAYRVFERYDPRTDRWERLPPYPIPASGIELLSIGGRLVAAGGEDPGRGRLIGNTWAYDPEVRRWARLPSMTRPKHGYAAVAAGGRFWAFGGAPCYGFEPSQGVDSLAVDA